MIAKAVLDEFTNLNPAQLTAIDCTKGPLLIIAGPGSGKTLVLVVRVLNILLQELAVPSEILLCTFTEKAAYELRDRVSLAAKRVGYSGNLSELLVGTIHGIANDFILRHRHHTPLGNNYEVLDELTQSLFLLDNFNEIVGPPENDLYLGKWSTRWGAISGLKGYLNKITEELIDPKELESTNDPFVRAIGRGYRAYQKILIETNRVDFAHQQKLFFDLLQNPDIGPSIRNHIRYVMIDEYQDTNYIQEQLLLDLSRRHNNIAVVGDEDQSIYRFRGATVRNILEFPSHFSECKTVTLSANYRSHRDIITGYNKYMQSWDWGDPNHTKRFRYEKTIEPDPGESFPEYPAIFSIWGETREDEARRVADLVEFMIINKVIEDESQVALLLHSVRQEHSGYYIQALAEKGIKSYCPRARSYFDNEEIRYMVACFALVLGYYGDGRGSVSGHGLQELARYVDGCIMDLAKKWPHPHPIAKLLQNLTWEVAGLDHGQTLDRHLADHFFQFLGHEPYSELVKNENRARNLAIFSQLLEVFQTYYHYQVITSRNREPLRFHFFHSFLRLLYEGGINEYEDPNEPFPKRHVQVMTIHQSKGLEFPVVIIGSLGTQISTPKEVDRVLSSFFHRPQFEPEGRITGFDRMRLHYVAFSRAGKILVLTTTDQPKPRFNPIWQGLPQWPFVRQDLLGSLSFNMRHRMSIKKTFSFTSDLKVYETCPRQYEFFRFYEFTPARSAQYFFGSLVHQTIEDIHRWTMDGNADTLGEANIRQFFDFNYHHLASRGIRPIGPKQRDEALAQIMNYFNQNKDEMRRIIETEVDVSLEKDRYILTGKVDLLLGDNNKLELLDFKSQPKPAEDEERLDAYYKQLCVYAHILEQRYGKLPDRLLLYWTSERYKKDALMVFPYQPELVEQAGAYFDQVVDCILRKDFAVQKLPEPKVCAECDLRTYCQHKRGGTSEQTVSGKTSTSKL